MKFRMFCRFLLSFTLLLSVIVPAAIGSASAASSLITLYLNGQQINSDVAPYILPEEGVTMVPMRVISEGLGASVGWSPSQQLVTVSSANTKISMTLGSKNADVNGNQVALDAAVAFKQDRTMVPLRFIGEQLGLIVTWNADARRVNLQTPDWKGDSTPINTGAGSVPESGPSSGSAPAADTFTDVRGAWIPTVYNLDWPSSSAVNNMAKQKAEYTTLLDKLKAMGINTVFVQVRPAGDALYPSAIVPWSNVLTGTQGKNPGYDPLKFMIDETHNRGMKFQAWFNPFRASTDSNVKGLANNHVSIQHPEWIVTAEGKPYINPGIPEARQHIIDSIMEVVKGYEVDGIHLDDYFYPYNGTFNDDATYLAYALANPIGKLSKDNWRRSNINTFVQKLDASIHAAKPSLAFGISPFGVWRNKSTDPTGSDTKAGVTAYDTTYADVRTWIKNGWIDYVVPQVYWSLSFSAARYDKVTDWWANEVKGTNVKLYIGHAPYKLGTSEAGWSTSDEIINQLNYNRNHPEITGDVFFSSKDLTKNPLGLISKLTAYYK